MYTGDLNVNLDGIAALSDNSTCAGFNSYSQRKEEYL